MDMAGTLERREAVVTEAQAGRLEGFLRALAAVSHGAARGMVEQGCVHVNGAPCTDPATPLAAGDRVAVAWRCDQRYRPRPRPRADRRFRIVYEDRALLVVDKAPGVLTHPNHGERDTLLDALSAYLGHDPGPGGGRRGRAVRAHLVHRLDRDTSGLLVFGKSAAAAVGLKEQFAARKPRRIYVAVVAGRLAAATGTFRSRLATDDALNQYSTGQAGEGRPAVTHYRVTHRLPGVTAVEVRLETGRRNQIRVHFAEAGHPVLGDPRYRPREARHPRWKIRRLALHAAELAFEHPLTGAALHFHAPLPAELARFLAAAAPSSATPPAPTGPAAAPAPRGAPETEENPSPPDGEVCYHDREGRAPPPGGKRRRSLLSPGQRARVRPVARK
jgi:23S rRNA pseudouridine1911/1915/1917 synthase